MKGPYRYFLLLCLIWGVACKSKSSAGTAQDTARPLTAAQIAQQPPAAGDEEQFDAFFDAFSEAVKQKDKKKLEGMLFFPFQTGNIWRNDDIAHMKDPATNERFNQVAEKEYGEYADQIFHPDVVRLLPRAEGEAIAEIAGDTKDDYYLRLKRHTDAGTRMYEVYLQYAEEGRSTESYFAFVFGKVKGQYKALSYYAKWPVKG